MRVARRAHTLGLLLATLGQLSAAPATAQERDGSFEIESVRSELIDGVHYLHAQVDYELSDAALEALRSGVTLTIKLQIEVTRPRRWMLDKGIASLLQKYELQFDALSQRYIVRNLNSGEQSSYATLFLALDKLGRVEGLPFLDAALLESGERYQISVRVVLDNSVLPAPLRWLTIWRDEWRIESEWYRWQLQS